MDELELIQIRMDSINKACRTVLKRKIKWLVQNLEAELQQLKDPQYIPEDAEIIRNTMMDINELYVKISLLNNLKN